MGTKPTFRENEKILCFHGPLIYEAKVLKVDSKEGESPKYFVHYKGWKQTWDEWVEEERTLKFTLENIAKQKQLNEAQRAKDRAEREAAQEREKQLRQARRAASSAANTSAELSSSRGTKRGRDSMAAENEEEFYKKPEIKIVIPDSLKIQLVDDWEAVTKNNQLVPLPREPNVKDILKQYEDYVQNTQDSDRPSRKTASLTQEVIAGLQLYFDKSLGNNLLYRFERGQYAEIRKKHGNEAEMSDIYGAEHLLRLFVNLPEMVAHTTMDVESVNVLRDYLTDFLKWMVKEQKQLFVKVYENTTSAYQNVQRA